MVRISSFIYKFYLFLDQILKNPIIQKRIEYFKSFTDESNEDQALLQTIRVPKNLLFLSDKLPQPNYEKVGKKNRSFTKKNQNDLPEIGVRNINIQTSKTNDHGPSSNHTEAKSQSLKKKQSNSSNREMINSSKVNENLATIAENIKDSVKQEREKSPRVIQKEIVINNNPVKRIEYPEDSAASNVHINRKNLSPSRNNDVSELPQIKNSNKR